MHFQKIYEDGGGGVRYDANDFQNMDWPFLIKVRVQLLLTAYIKKKNIL